MTVDPSVVEADLAAGRLCCPGCAGWLAAWGHAREREVRMLDGVRSLRPRRAYCRACETTHVLLPAWSVPRRRDGAEVIGSALLDKAGGAGHRTIAARLGCPPGTVRGWLRTFARRAEEIGRSARSWAHAIDASLTPARPPTDVGEAIVSYLRRRPRCEWRALFLRVKAPRGELDRSAIAWVVRAACDRAGLPRVGPHRLRHTAATEMLRRGASLREIGQVLRHREQKTTAIYAKVDRAALRALARPWRSQEGGVA
jgi:hypothetical protein